MREGRSPTAQTVFYLREENRRLFEENQQLRVKGANLKRQIEVWRRSQEEPDGFRNCAACKKPKPLAEFCRDRSRLRGYRSYCRTCDKERYPDRRGSGGRHGKLGLTKTATHA